MVSAANWAEVALATGFAVWLLASVVNSTEWGFRKLGGTGVHHVVPRWNFFAPHPGVADYHLLYRDEHADGHVGAWQEASGFHQPRGPTAAVWHPDKFGKKALFDLTQELMRTHEGRDDDRERGDVDSSGSSVLTPVRSDSIKLTTAYIALLNYVVSRDRPETATARQFVVMRTSGLDGTTEPVFLSAFHSL